MPQGRLTTAWWQLVCCIGLLVSSLTAQAESIQQAFMEQDFIQAEALLANGADPNALIEYSDYQGRLIHIAAEHGEQWLELLLPYKPQLDVLDSYDRSALHIVANNDDYQSVIRLLDAGMAPDFVNSEQHTPLFWAIANDGYQAAKRLVEAGADINHQAGDSNVIDMLSYSYSAFSLDNFVWIARHGGDPNLSDGNGRTLLSLILMTADHEGLMALRNLGEPWSNHPLTQIYAAIVEDDLASFQGHFTPEQLGYVDLLGSSYLHIAVQNHAEQISQYLLTQGAKLDQYDFDGTSVLDVLTQQDKQSLFVSLLPYLMANERARSGVLVAAISRGDVPLWQAWQTNASAAELDLGALADADYYLTENEIVALYRATEQDFAFAVMLLLVQDYGVSELMPELKKRDWSHLSEQNARVLVEQLSRSYSADLTLLAALWPQVTLADDEQTQQWLWDSVTYGNTPFTLYAVQHGLNFPEQADLTHMLQLVLENWPSLAVSKEDVVDYDESPSAQEIEQRIAAKKAQRQEIHVASEALVGLLLDAGADVTAYDDAGKPLLFSAVKLSDKLWQRMTNGIALDELTSHDGEGLLPTLLAHSPAKAVQFIQKMPAKFRPEWSESMMAAEMLGQAELRDALWQKGAGLDAFDDKGLTLLHRLYANEQLESLKMLIQQRMQLLDDNKQAQQALINHPDLQQHSLLFKAIERRQTDFARWLLQQGAQWQTEVSESIQPLSALVAQFQPELLKQALKDDALIQQGDKYQRSLLQLAIQGGNRQVVKWLLEKGAEVAYRDSLNRSAFDHAMLAAYPDVIDLFKSLSIVEDTRDSLFSDERILRWSFLIMAGDSVEALKDIGRDLKSAHSHPFAAFAWIEIAKNLNQLPTAVAELPSALKGALERPLQIHWAIEKEQYQTVQQLMPIDQLSERDLFWVNLMAQSMNKFDAEEIFLPYLEQAARIAPGFWQTAWNYIDDDWLLDPAFQQRAIRLADEPELQGSFFAEYIQQSIQAGGIYRADRIPLLRRWVAATGDPRAATALNYDLAGNYRYQEALQYAQIGVIRSPFYSNRNQVARKLLRLDRDAEAKRWTQLTSGWYQGIETQSDRALRYLSEAYRLVGDKGTARDYLMAVETSQNSSDYYWKAVARLESGDEREPESLTAWRKAAEYDQQPLDSVHSLLSQLMKMERLSEAGRVFQTAQQQGWPRYYNEWTTALDVAKKLQDQALFDTLLANALERYPSSTQLRRQYIEDLLAKQRVGEEHMQQMEQMLTRRPNHNSTLDLWYQVSQQVRGDASTLASLREMTSSRPNIVRYWKKLMLASGADATQKLQQWREAVQSHPQQLALYIELSLQAVSNKRYQEALQILFDAQKLSPSLASDWRDVWLHQMWTLEKMSEAGKLSSEQIDVFAQALENYWQQDNSAFNYWRYMESMQRAAGDMQAAANALFKKGELGRDSTGTYHDLVARYSGELSNLQRHGFGLRMLQRNPYSAKHYNSYLHKALRWGAASPVTALKVIEEGRRKGVAVDETYEQLAREKLGDSLAGFLFYKKSSQVGVSQRYLNWFDIARRDALFNDNKQIIYHLEGDFPKVDIVMADGQVVHREDDARFGKMRKLSRGAAFIRADYDDNGNLREIETSAGDKIQLGYTPKNKISSMTDGESSLLFGYNQNDKLNFIQQVGVGSVHIRYQGNEVSRIESAAGHKMVLKVTQLFQQLKGLVDTFSQASDPDDLPELTIQDAQKEALIQQFDEADWGSRERDIAGLNLAAYLFQNLSDSPDYAQQVQDLTEQVFEQRRTDTQDEPTVIRAIDLWWQLQHQLRPHGVDSDTYATAQAMQLWASSIVKGKASTALRQSMTQQPILRLPNTNWLSRNELSNEGYWYREANAQLFADQSAPEITSMLQAVDGDVYLGTEKGLLVRRQGYWSWLNLDPRSGQLVRDSQASQRDAMFVTGLGQTDDGVIWIATRQGLLAVAPDQSLQIWQTEQQGLRSASIDSLLAYANTVWLANGKHLLSVSSGHQSMDLMATSSTTISAISAGPEGQPLVLSAGQLGWYSDGQIRDFAQRAESALWWPQEQQIWWWDGRQLKSANWQQQLQLQPTLRADKSLLPMSKRIFGLHLYAPPGLDAQPMVLTDQGLALWREGYFESLSLPYQDARGGMQIGAYQMAYLGQDLLLATEDGFYRFMPSRSQRLPLGKVRDIAYVERQKMTYFATDNGLYAIPDSAQREQIDPIRVSSIRATVLAVTEQGDLLANDYMTVVKFPFGRSQPQELFDAQQGLEGDKYHGPVRDIFADKDGTIWVVAGSSLFRWRADSLTEYNYFLDPKRFPARSDMLTRVYRDIHGDLYVIASNEGHRFHQSVKLSGGVLKYQGDKFTRLEDYQDRPWFVTGYTPLSDDRAILSTSGHFALQQFGSIQSFADLSDPSYKQMREQAPMIFLGGEGAKLGDQKTWLFPSAGGVVVYHNQQWFYPDRINRLLPQDQALGQYGARTVHALSTDSQGRVFVGTDLGLLVYQAGNAASLLTDHQRGDLAFIDQSNQTQQAMQSIFLDRFPANSEQGRLIRQYRDLQQQVEKLTSKQNVEDTSRADSADVVARGVDGQQAEQLAKELRRKERQRQRLLAELEKEHYGLYQMLKLDPREIAAMHRQLSEKQVLVQYLPTPDKLLIQVVDQNGAQIREVAVSEQKLQLEAKQLAELLRQRALQLDPQQRGFTSKSAVLDSADVLQAKINEKLTGLYDVLLRPVEKALSEKQQVYITPVGALTYVPFAALLRDNRGQTEYAAERFNLGILPSMYHFSLMMQQDESFSDKALFISDPDGSLPGARQEVGVISQQYPFESEVLEGQQASLDELSYASQDSRLIHFATHGVLSRDNPADSYLVMANGERLGVIDIAMLDLQDTDVVVLSACDSGVGTQGLEYATLARAFAHAKVPSVVASYWAVNDAATSKLMEALYESLQDPEADLFVALAKAQRQLILQGGDLADPSAWAAFTVFGKP